MFKKITILSLILGISTTAVREAQAGTSVGHPGGGGVVESCDLLTLLMMLGG